MPNQNLPGVITTPSQLIITGMSQSSPMVVDFVVPTASYNAYHIGQVVKLRVPRPWGMMQADGLVGKILSIGMTTMLLNIDSSQFDAFVTPTGNVEAPASLAPAGSQNLEYDNTTNRVPFQSLNNRGN
jgi:hypothetical protein